MKTKILLLFSLLLVPSLSYGKSVYISFHKTLEGNMFFLVIHGKPKGQGLYSVPTKTDKKGRSVANEEHKNCKDFLAFLKAEFGVEIKLPSPMHAHMGVWQTVLLQSFVGSGWALTHIEQPGGEGGIQMNFYKADSDK